MSSGRICDCPRTDHEPVYPWHGTDKDTLRHLVPVGGCRKYAADQERGGRCNGCREHASE